ncbi:Histone H1 [Apostasia shenzhenica]|uniref:Histone H1 n=1 Tax=Apostasia shenzhenica TaxID=1088818 RepID=A0A2I0ACU2_9ASPA|nr:Histone H1 [Apostasia shenzhenica]
MAAVIPLRRDPLRRTPDHPPYATMIGEAIRKLRDAGGSTEPAISEYIISHFDGLPWAHDRLYPYLLRKLVAMGEFAEPTPGRFLLAADMPVSARMRMPAPAAEAAASEAASSLPDRDFKNVGGPTWGRRRWRSWRRPALLQKIADVDDGGAQQELVNSPEPWRTKEEEEEEKQQFEVLHQRNFCVRVVRPDSTKTVAKQSERRNGTAYMTR